MNLFSRLEDAASSKSRLKATLEDLLEAERHHLDELADDAGHRQARDAAVAALRADVFDLRDLLRGAFGRLKTEDLGFERRLSNHARPLMRQRPTHRVGAARSRARASRAALPRVTVDPGMIADDLRPRLRELPDAIDRVTREESKAPGTKIAKDQAMKVFDGTYQEVVRTLVGAFRTAVRAEFPRLLRSEPPSEPSSENFGNAWYHLDMDENRPPYRLHAPGTAATPSYELPAHRDATRSRRRPRVDEHVIRPELERLEMIDGEILETLPAEIEHAVQNGDLDYLLRAHLAPGYRVATDLVTRHDRDADFASDSAVVHDGIDPSTGSRYREELAFEVVSEQPKARATRKAPKMLERGVKRVFAVFVKTRVVAEWEPDERLEGRGRWVELAADAKIYHPSLAEPMPVAAILDAASADDTVARALDAKGNPVIREIREKEKAEGKIEGLAEGEIKGKAEAILTVLAGRGLHPSGTVRRRILSTTDLATLERWLMKAVTVSSPEEIVED